MSRTRLTHWAVWALLGLGLSACARFEHHDPAYLTAERRAALAVPPDLNTPTDLERLPAQPSAPSAVPQESPGASPALGVLPPNAQVQLVRAGGQRWLKVEATPATLWPLVQAFFRSQGFRILRATPATGIFVTDWRSHPVKLESGQTEHYVGQLFPTLFEAGRKQRYRVRLEADRSAGATEVYITRAAVREVVIPDPVMGGATHRWQLNPPNPARDADALSALRAYLGQQQLPSIQATQPAPADGTPALAPGGGAPQAPAPTTPPAGGPAPGPGPGGSGMPLSSGSSGSATTQPLAAGAVSGGALRANQMAAPRGPYDWQRVGVALAEAGATVVRADRAEASYAVRFAQGPNAATRVSRLMARRRAQAQTYRVVLASNVLTVEPGQAASPLVAGLRSQLR